MKRWARAIGMAAIGLGLVLGVARGPIAAQEAAPEDPGGDVAPVPEDAEARRADRGIRLFGELLFLKPTLDDTAFAIASTATSPVPDGGPIGETVDDEFDFEPAFRIGAAYELAGSGRELELSYLRLDAEASEAVAGSSLWATRGSPHFATSFEAYPGTASAEIDARLDRIDAHVSQPIALSGLDLALQFGVEWADFRVGEKYAYANAATATTGALSEASRSWGIGPALGLGLEYRIGELWIPGSLSLDGGASAGVLVAETHTRSSSTVLGAPVVSVRDEETSRILPAIHVRIGVGYAVAVANGIGAELNVGYQIDSYLDGLTRRSFVDDIASAQSSTEEYDFDLQGVYASLGVVF